MKPLQLRCAYRWRDRARGLIGYPRLRLGQGLLIHPCRAVHGWGMRYPLDVAFLDRQARIRKMGVLKPGGWLVCWTACAALELAPGSLAYYGWKEGQCVAALVPPVTHG
ncbi:MAG: DUF192 domain-containing protein [Pigmentiphaga sp.]|nr:DUF192 domain-containing protein [Pigmentiphaga sp.]